MWRLDMTMEDSQVLRAIRDRRSAREFLDAPVEKKAIARIIEAGRLAASGANRQPWHFVVVDDPAIKRNLRSICEAAERSYYAKAPEELGSGLRSIRSAQASRSLR